MQCGGVVADLLAEVCAVLARSVVGEQIDEMHRLDLSQVAAELSLLLFLDSDEFVLHLLEEHLDFFVLGIDLDDDAVECSIEAVVDIPESLSYYLQLRVLDFHELVVVVYAPVRDLY